MSLPRFVAATLCTVLCASAVVAQEAVKEVAVGQEEAEQQAVAEAADAIPFAQDGEQLLATAVNRELKLASKIAGLTEAQVTKITEGLKGVISKHAKKTEGRGVSMMVIGMGDLDDELSDHVLKAVKSQAKDKDLVAAYEKDVMLRRQFKRESVVAMFIQSLDSRVGLGSDQIKAVSELAVKLYEDDKLPQDAAFGIMTPGAKPQEIAELKTLLTQQQQRYYKEFGGIQPFGQATVFDSNGQPERDEKKEREKLLTQLRMVAEMKLDYLDRELQLSEKQKKKLQLISKGVLASAADEKMAATKAFADYQESMMAGNGGAIEPPDPDMMSKAMAHPVQAFASQPRWQKFVKSALTTGQKARLEEIEVQKQKRTSTALCSTLVMAFGREIQLNGKQKIGMRDLLKMHIKPSPGSDGGLMSLNRVETFRGLLAIKEADWIAAMGEENWEKFRPQLGQLRQELERRGDKAGVEE